MRETRELWEAWSEDFQRAWNAETDEDEGERPPAPIHYGPGFPESKRLTFLPPFEGRAVIEVGCGGGQASVGFARHGADSVVGVDLSHNQLRHARRLKNVYDVADVVNVVHGDVTTLPVASDQFDLAFSSWVFQMVPDLTRAFTEAARVIDAGGTFVFAVPHPFYELFDPDTHELTRSYFETTPERKSIGDLEPALPIFHHTVGAYHRALTEAGFTVDRVLEPGSPDPAEYDEQWSHKPDLMAHVPPTLVVRAILE